MTSGQREAPAPGELIEKIGDLTDLRSVVREIKRGAHEIPPRVGAQIEDLLRLAALAAASPSPAVPEEPPNGTVLAWDTLTDDPIEGGETYVARRADDCATGDDSWLVGGECDLRSWSWLVEHGAATARRLVVVDPTDEALVTRVSLAIAGHSPLRDGYRSSARAALRAIAGEEQ